MSCGEHSLQHRRPLPARVQRVVNFIDACAPREEDERTEEVVMSSTLPLHPTDDGWPYPDASGLDMAADAPDFDALELLGPHAFDGLTRPERDELFSHFGLYGHDALSMKQLAPALGCTRAEAAALVGSAIDKMRVQLLRE